MRGQNLRLGLKDPSVLGAVNKYIAGALSFDLSIDCDTEESTTKDSTNGWKEYEAMMKGWSGSGQAELCDNANDTAAVQGWDISDLVGKTLVAEFDYTDGVQNRSLVEGRKRGSVIITSWKINSTNKEKVKVDFSFQGTGVLENIDRPTPPPVPGGESTSY